MFQSIKIVNTYPGTLKQLDLLFTLLTENLFQLKSYVQVSQNILLGKIGWMKSRHVELLWWCVLLIDSVFTCFEGKKYFSSLVSFLGFNPINAPLTSFCPFYSSLSFLKMSSKCWVSNYFVMLAKSCQQLNVQRWLFISFCDMNCLPVHLCQLTWICWLYFICPISSGIVSWLFHIC